MCGVRIMGISDSSISPLLPRKKGSGRACFAIVWTDAQPCNPIDLRFVAFHKLEFWFPWSRICQWHHTDQSVGVGLKEQGDLQRIVRCGSTIVLLDAVVAIVPIVIIDARFDHTTPVWGNGSH